MKNKLLLSVFLCFSIHANAMTVGDYREAKKGGQIPDVMQAYLIGLGTGVFWGTIFYEVNMDANGTSYQKLFCPPKKMSIQGKMYEGFLDTYIDRVEVSDGEHLGVTLTKSLIYTFPCDR